MSFWKTLNEPALTARDIFVQKNAAALPKGTKILDVGAGPTRFRNLFSHCTYHAQDFAQHEGSKEGLMAEKEWFYGKLDFVSDATDIPVENESYDAILCTEVIEHVPNPDMVIKEIARILRKGGKLILTAPMSSGLHQEPHHFFAGFTPYYYKLKLGELGFTEISITPNGRFFSFHAQETQRFSALIAPWRLKLLPAIILFPVWILSLPWCRFFLPMIAKQMDKLDKHNAFTVGYHVTAIR